MRKVVLLCLFGLLLLAPSLRAQNVVVGGGGGDLYNNIFGAAFAQVELPLGKHVETDMEGQISPRIHFAGHTFTLENKPGVGSGYSYGYGPTGRIWFNKSWGVDGGFDASSYHVPAVSKSEYFARGGFTYRRIWFGTPTRFQVDYVQEVLNHLMQNGTEPNDLRGGSVTITSQFGCVSFLCFRLITNIQGGYVLNQGNPACDGSGAPNPQHLPFCKRTGATAGGASWKLGLTKRHRGHENELF